MLSKGFDRKFHVLIKLVYTYYVISLPSITLMIKKDIAVRSDFYVRFLSALQNTSSTQIKNIFECENFGATPFIFVEYLKVLPMRIFNLDNKHFLA